MTKDDDNFMPPANPYNMPVGTSPYGFGDDAMEPGAVEGAQAFAGNALPDTAETATEEEVIAAMKTVHDPEIPVNIFDLGLIYECAMDEAGDVAVKMTLTAPACPVAGTMPQMVADAVAGVQGVGKVVVTLTWAPAWTPEMMSDDAKLALGF